MDSRLKGVVKWFDESKGFGFVVEIHEEGGSVDGKPMEYFVHFSEIDADNKYKTLPDGQTVMFTPSKGEKGMVAKRVKAINF